MEQSYEYEFLMKNLHFVEDLRETETDKTKISVYYDSKGKTTRILRICKNRDLSDVCKVLCNVSHPNLVKVYKYLYENGNTYILEENINGDTLEKMIEERGVFDENETAKLIIKICDALQRIHEMKSTLIHNDIKPANIKVCDDGNVKLFDFDISRVYKRDKSQNTELFGSRGYDAPEHHGYGQSEPRTDIYSLGGTMHKMLTGKELPDNHVSCYHGKLKRIVDKCLRADLKQRYRSASKLKKALEGFLNRRRRCLVGIISLFFIAAFIFITVLSMNDLYGKKRGGNVTTDRAPETVLSADPSGKEQSTDQTDSVDRKDSSAPTSALTEEVQNHSKKDAYSIQFGKEYKGAFTEDDVNADWFRFKTASKESYYRFSFERKHHPDHMWTELVFSLYDADEIKIHELKMNRYSSDFLDLYLPANREYVCKVSAQYPIEYQFVTDQKECDAGFDKDHAAELTLDSRTEARIDSTLGDWYSFTSPRDGEYKITFFNVGVGVKLELEYWKKSGGLQQYSWVEAEENREITFSLEKDDVFYFVAHTVDAEAKEADGKYYILVEKQ